MAFLNDFKQEATKRVSNPRCLGSNLAPWSNCLDHCALRTPQLRLSASSFLLLRVLVPWAPSSSVRSTGARLWRDNDQCFHTLSAHYWRNILHNESPALQSSQEGPQERRPLELSDCVAGKNKKPTEFYAHPRRGSSHRL